MTEAVSNVIIVIAIGAAIVGFRWIVMQERIRQHRITMNVLAEMTPEQLEAICPDVKKQVVPF